MQLTVSLSTIELRRQTIGRVVTTGAILLPALHYDDPVETAAHTVAWEMEPLFSQSQSLVSDIKLSKSSRRVNMAS